MEKRWQRERDDRVAQRHYPQNEGDGWVTEQREGSVNSRERLWTEEADVEEDRKVNGIVHDGDDEESETALSMSSFLSDDG